ncbi:UDP-N-acetylmuramoyl-L-alanyl-D-glutamate--2,6-diaminopimelate ligase [bacterium]|nr:UDP-N-acetylmuramoyl-L-alanyl-D-glutamate--2,6-diaminopimelate ligase [bacterium]NDG29926.1 UDP-N-acetylmuramoyl-L-alanyl-D-glutamate--2,6-diaminopimelate ligase [bacterium]
MGARDMVKKLVPTRLFMAIEPLGHWAEAVVWNIAMGFPSRGLKVIGVTGTDGKTSTSTLITQMLRENGLSVAMMTTISVDYGDGRGEVPNPTRLTTMGARDLLQKIKKIKANNVNWLVLETTSHALAQHRVWGVPYGIAVFTNLGHEHLDYHKTFERYRDAKRLLFKQTNANKKGLRIGIVNADDGVASYFASDIANPMMYGIKNGEYRATNIKMTPQGSSYTVKTKDQTYHITCHVPGSFNVYNSLAAVCVGQAIGLNKEQIQKGIAGLKAVEGRMTRVDEGQDFDVIVDYAHTPESFDKIFAEVKPLAKGRLICVFGSAGRRDEAKRAAQGKIAGKWCDVVIATEEDDRDIDGNMILDQIASGAVASGKVVGKDAFKILIREEAVQKAIDIAQKGDLVILLGKGHEKSILYNGPKAAELRHLPQNDSDPQRVLKRDYDEVMVAQKAIRQKLAKR